MADMYAEAAQEVARLRKINRDLSRLRLEGLVTGERGRRRILDTFDRGIVQKLVSLQLRLDALPKKTGPSADVTALRELIGSAIETAHLLADAMAPHVLFRLGLKAALQELLNKYCRDHGVRCFIDAENAGLDAIDETTGLVLYDLIERLLGGAVCGCRADTIDIRVRTAGAKIEITIEDNGVELDLQEIVATGQVSEKPLLVEIAEEVRFLAGEVWVGRAPGSRTICLVMPRKISALSL